MVTLDVRRTPPDLFERIFVIKSHIIIEMENIRIAEAFVPVLPLVRALSEVNSQVPQPIKCKNLVKITLKQTSTCSEVFSFRSARFFALEP